MIYHLHCSSDMTEKETIKCSVIKGNNKPLLVVKVQKLLIPVEINLTRRRASIQSKFQVM